MTQRTEYTEGSWGAAWAEQHQAKLESSAITLPTASARGYRTITEKATLDRLDFTGTQRRTPGLLIPLWNVNGQTAGFQYRPDKPRTLNGRTVKYENRKGSKVVLDVPPGAHGRIDDPTETLWITEGPLKADAAIDAGLCCVALLGVWNWRGTNGKGGKTVLPDFDHIALNDRDIVLAFDSDSRRKVSVYDALQRLAAMLTNRGATVRYCHLPDSSDNKTGLDDHLAAGATTDDLEKLISDDPGERPTPPATEPVGHDGHHFTDSGNAQRLIAGHGEHLRYVPSWACWMVWDTQRFVTDLGAVRATDLAGDVARRLWEAVPELTDKVRDQTIKWATRSESAKAHGDLLKLARSIPGVAVDHEDFDTDPWLLNLENGLLDLRTGTLGPHDPEKLCSRIAGTRWQPDATAPEWERFLERVLPDSELRSFVQRAVGYSLTGDVSAQVLFIATGAGANGKSTLLNVVGSLLGEYGVTAPKDLLIQTRHEAHPTSMTQLYRARMATAVETERGATLAEAQVKQLTGGDKITARRMREDFWTFDPTHKLWIGCNALPRIAGGDHAIWRRIRVIPFDVIIPDNEQDPHLTGKLETELPGILAWAIGGCRAWQRDGLEPPAAVTAATDAYRAEQDWFTRFCEDKGWELAPGFGVESRSRIAEDYRTWCQTEGQHPMSAKALTQELRKRGLVEAMSNGQRLWKGIGRAN